MSQNPESIIYIRSEDILRIFVISIAVLLVVAIFFLGRSVGKNEIRKDLLMVCKTGEPFTAEGFEGIFSCYRLDVEDK